MSKNIKLARQLVRLALDLVKGQNVTAKLNTQDELQKFWETYGEYTGTPEQEQALKHAIHEYVSKLQGIANGYSTVYNDFVESQRREADLLADELEKAKQTGGKLKGLARLRNLWGFYLNLGAFKKYSGQINKRDLGMRTPSIIPDVDFTIDGVPYQSQTEKAKGPGFLELPFSLLQFKKMTYLFDVYITKKASAHQLDPDSQPEQWVEIEAPELSDLESKLFIAFSQKRSSVQMLEASLNAAMLGGKTFDGIKSKFQNLAKTSFKNIQGMIVNAEGLVVAFSDSIAEDKQVLEDVKDDVSEAREKAIDQSIKNPAFFDKNHPQGIDPKDENVFVSSSKTAGVIDWFVSKVSSAWNKMKSAFESIRQKIEDFGDAVDELSEQFGEACRGYRKEHDVFESDIRKNAVAFQKAISKLSDDLDDITRS